MGKKYLNTLISINNLAGLLKSQDKYDYTKPIYQQILTLQKKVLSKEHPDILISMNNLTKLLKSQGNYNNTESIYQQTLALREKILSKEYLNTLTSINNLAGLLKSQGNYDNTKPIYRQTLALREKVLGKEVKSWDNWDFKDRGESKNKLTTLNLSNLFSKGLTGSTESLTELIKNLGILAN